jgi:hypothetical protein
MTVTTCRVIVAANDYYINSTTGYTAGTGIILASHNNVIVPNYDDIITAIVDCSAIPAGDVISAATVKFDAGTYAISGRPAPSRDYILQMWNGTFYQAIATNVGWSAGVNSNSLNATQQGWIGNVGGNSIFKLLVSDPGAGRSKQMNVEAYENNVNTTVRIDITHAPPFSGQVINILSS